MPNYNGFEYEVVDGEVTITRWTGTERTIKVPMTIEGMPVVEIADLVFAGLDLRIDGLYISPELRRIGEGAFFFNTFEYIYVANPNVILEYMALGIDTRTIMYGFRDSTAYDYAVENGFNFQLIPVEVDSIKQPNAISVEYDADINLPESVTVVLNNGETDDINVNWPYISTKIEGTYTIEGMLRLPGNIDNPKGLRPSIELTVIKHSVTGFETIPDVVTDYGETPELPQNITVNLSNGNSIGVDVAWDLSNFDNTVKGDHTITGTFNLPEQYKNPDDYQPTVTITVDKRSIVSIEDVPDITIDYGDNYHVPDYITATLDDGSQVELVVRWDDTETITNTQIITDYVGTIEVPRSIDAPIDLDISVTVTMNKRYITSVQPIDNQSVEFGTGLNSLPLPSMVAVDFSNGESGYLTVTWDMGTPTYQSLTPQDYTFTGTLRITDEYTYNRDDVQAEIVITLDKPIPKSEKPSMSKEIYIFDDTDTFQTILSQDNGLISTYFQDVQNEIVDEAFVMYVDNKSELLHFIAEENQVAFYDRSGELRLMRIKEIYEETSNDGHVLKAVAEPAYLELYDHFIEDRRIVEGTAQTALNRALEGSRYTGVVNVQLGEETDNFYWINGVEAIFKILDTWGGALKDTIALNENNEIVERKILILARRGKDSGLIVEPDHNAESIGRDTLSYPKTAMWGQGASLEIEDEQGEHTGGYTRYLTFEDVEWSKANGDPADKPLGQKWIGDPQALARYGYKNFPGGRNLITKDSVSTNNTTEKDYVYTLSGHPDNRAGISVSHELFETNTDYVITFKIKKLSGSITNIGGHSSQIAQTSTTQIYCDGQLVQEGVMWGSSSIEYPDDNETHQYEIRFKTTTDFDGDNPTWHIQPNRLIYETEYVAEIWDWQLEKGNKATDWSPAPEEMENPYLHREGHFSNQDYDNPEELLWATWQALQEEQLAEVTHEAKIYEGEKQVNLGDTVALINRKYNKPIEVQSQITGLGYDILDDHEVDIVVGKYVDMSDPLGDELDKIRDDIKNVNKRPSRISEGSYPNIKPNVPFDVVAEGGYRTIQLYWTYTDEIYVKHYEVYGSQIDGFAPSEQTLLWKGNVSAYAHIAEMDERWHFRVCAVNYHGTRSDYSEQVSANTARDISPDIMFGSIKAEQLEDMLDLAGKLDNGTLDWINEGAYQYVDELREGIIDDVQKTVGTIATDVAHLINRADDLTEKVVDHEVLIQENHDSILERVTSQELNLVENTFNQAISEVERKADGISQRVEQTNTRIDNIDLGGTNFITHLPNNWEQGYITTGGNDTSSNTTLRIIDYYRIDPNTIYTLTAYGNYEVTYREYDNQREVITNHQQTGQNGSITFTTSANARYFRVYVRRYGYPDNQVIIPEMIGTDIKIKLSLSDSESGWTPNIDDTSELVSHVQSYVSEFNQRADGIELSVADVEGQVDDLKVNAIAYINITPGEIKIGGDKISITGETFIENGVIGTAAIANLAVDKAHLKNAIIDDVHVNNLSGKKIIAGTVTADKTNINQLSAITGNMGTLTAGILRSSNSNMELNLNRGTLRMSNADFSLGGGATIDFTSVGNRITYERVGDGIRRTAGIGIGRSINDKYPYIFMGTVGHNKNNLDAMDDKYFTGFISNTNKRMSVDGIGNSAVGVIFHVRDKAVSFSKGFEFNLEGSNNFRMRPMNAGNYNYWLGASNNHFSGIYVNQVRVSDGELYIRNTHDTSQGFSAMTSYQGESQMAFFGLNAHNKYYNLGKSNRRFSYVYLRYQPNVSSDARLKHDIKDNTLGLAFIKDVDTKSFVLNDDDEYRVQTGFIAQQLNKALNKHGDNLSIVTKGTDGYFGVEHSQLIAPAYKGIQELDDKFDDIVNEIDIRIEDKDRRIKRLEKKVSELEKAVA